MSKRIAHLLNDMALVVYGYPKQVATIDKDDRLLVEVDNRYVEDMLEEAVGILKMHAHPSAAHPNQLSFDF
jgi:hypothetical protein